RRVLPRLGLRPKLRAFVTEARHGQHANRSRLSCHQSCVSQAVAGPLPEGPPAGSAGPCLFSGDTASLLHHPTIADSRPTMRLSRYFLPILRETPKEAEIVSHRLMLRAGMLRQEAAGIYAWLPLGFRVLKKIEQIVREEMDRAGAIELLMPTLQLADLWRESG